MLCRFLYSKTCKHGHRNKNYFCSSISRLSFSCLWREGGKSGQQRATHRLTAGFNMFGGNIEHEERDSATENNYHGFDRGKAENVR